MPQLTKFGLVSGPLRKYHILDKLGRPIRLLSISEVSGFPIITLIGCESPKSSNFENRRIHVLDGISPTLFRPLQLIENNEVIMETSSPFY